MGGKSEWSRATVTCFHLFYYHESGHCDTWKINCCCVLHGQIHDGIVQLFFLQFVSMYIVWSVRVQVLVLVGVSVRVKCACACEMCVCVECECVGACFCCCCCCYCPFILTYFLYFVSCLKVGAMLGWWGGGGGVVAECLKMDCRLK